MKLCSNCGHQNPDTNSFCSECGNTLPATGTQATQQTAAPVGQQNAPVNQLPPQNYSVPQTQQKKTKSNAAIIIALILFFPLGLYWMWAKSNWKKGTKIVVTIIIAIFVIGSASSGGTDNNNAKQTNGTAVSESYELAENTTKSVDKETTTEPTTSKKEYKEACKKYEYKDIARNPNDYEGKMAKFTGQVIQVQESSFLGTKTLTLRVNVTAEENEFAEGGYLYEDTVYVTYYPSEDESRILEDDIITMYGELTGVETYDTVLGSTVTIPSMTAEYIDIK